MVEAVSESPGQSVAFIRGSYTPLQKMVIMAFILVMSVATAETQFATDPCALVMRALGAWYPALLGSPVLLNSNITFQEKTKGFFFFPSQNKWPSLKYVWKFPGGPLDFNL